MPDNTRAGQPVAALRDAGFTAADILESTAAEEEDEIFRRLRHASDFAGYGYAVTLTRRYQELAAQGAH